MPDDYGPDRSNIASGRGKVPTKKKSKPAKSKPATAGRYDWGDGKGKAHSIPKSQHERNVAAQRNYGLGPDTPLDAPLTAQQAWGIAQASADRTYAPQIQATQQMQANAPVWYQNYISQVGESQKAAQAYAQPVVDTARTAVTNAGATTPGLDPSSPQYAKELEAAKGRQAFTQLGADTLAAIPQATNAYMAGQQAIAARELPQVQAGLLYQLGQQRSLREGAVNEAYGQARTGEQNAGIARATLGLNTSKAAADTDLARGVDPVTGRPLPKEAPKGYTAGGPGMNKYGYTYDEWNKHSETWRARQRAKFGQGSGGGKTPEQKEAAKKEAAEKKRVAGIRKATGGFQGKVRDAQTAWERYARVKNPATDANGNEIAGKFVKATPDQIKQKLREEKYTETEIHVMLMLRGGKKLTPSEIDQIKQQNPDIRIPREWLANKKRKAPRKPKPPSNAPSGYGRDEGFGGT